jgi:hypothetical protein
MWLIAYAIGRMLGRQSAENDAAERRNWEERQRLLFEMRKPLPKGTIRHECGCVEYWDKSPPCGISCQTHFPRGLDSRDLDEEG